MNLEMQKVPVNHAFLESGDQLLSNSKSYLGNTFQFEQFTYSLDANVKAQTYLLRPGNVFRIRYMQDVVTTYFPTFLLRTDMVLIFTLTSRPYPYVTKTFKLQCHNDLHITYFEYVTRT
jgi:hypothetical protein